MWREITYLFLLLFINKFTLFRDDFVTGQFVKEEEVDGEYLLKEQPISKILTFLTGRMTSIRGHQLTENKKKRARLEIQQETQQETDEED